MPIWRLQVASAADSLFPADNIIITPHFNDAGATTDPQNLCDDLAAAMATYWAAPRQVEVKAYDAEGTPPVYPAASAIVNQGLFPASQGIREVAICLSYFATTNRPRTRGRLYLPPGLMVTTTFGVPRPSQAVRDKAAALVPILAGLGGVDVDWCVYSRVDGQARKVTDWWVDDAWDIQRSRGLIPTIRSTGTTSG
jgi:hypothetical protein